MWTTPGRPVKLTRNARRISSGIRSAEGTCTENFVIGAVTPTWLKY